MKKIFAILLAALLLLGLAACAKSADSAKAAEPAAPAAAEAPTAVPTDTPAPTEVPADVAVVNALTKLDQLSSMHMDLTMLMDMSIGISAEGMNMDMPIKMNMGFLMDVQKDPAMSRMDATMDVDMGPVGKQTQTFQVYADMTGETPAAYSSTDGGVTWTKSSGDGESPEQLDPQDTLNVLKSHVQGFEKTGAETFGGKAVTVYEGKLDGQYAQEILAATGMSEMLEDMNVNDPTGGSVALGDIPVTVYVDDETGYPVYYAMDMTDMLKDALGAAMEQAMGVGGLEGMEVKLEVPAIKTECTLSQFDSVPPIEIPAAALAAAGD